LHILVYLLISLAATGQDVIVTCAACTHSLFVIEQKEKHRIARMLNTWQKSMFQKYQYTNNAIYSHNPNRLEREPQSGNKRQLAAALSLNNLSI